MSLERLVHSAKSFSDKQERSDTSYETHKQVRPSIFTYSYKHTPTHQYNQHTSTKPKYIKHTNTNTHTNQPELCRQLGDDCLLAMDLCLEVRLEDEQLVRVLLNVQFLQALAQATDLS